MASEAKTIGSTDPTQPGTPVEERERLLQSTREQEIRNRAYEIYLQRGGGAVLHPKVVWVTTTCNSLE